MRFAACVEYRGGNYQGWETQKNGPTVQAAVEAALARIAVQPVRTTCAGRTDSGVHAFGQVIHFDTDVVRPAQAWVLGTNTHLPRDVTIVWAHEVPEEFNARFSATSRRYRYVILNRRTRPGVLSGLVTCVHTCLNEQAMAAAASALVGRHDFSAYRASRCQAHSPIREVSRCDVWRDGELVIIEVEANAFLHHMVRNIAGVLIAIGAGMREVDWAATVLAGRLRTQGGVTALPDGLYFLGPTYPSSFGLPPVSSPGALW